MEEYRFQSEIEAFEHSGEQSPLPEKSVLFYGSSSIRLWTTLPTDFSTLSTVNRGFGGAELEDMIRYTERIVTPLRPATVVLYGGDNDLSNGKSPEQVFSDYIRLINKLRENRPDGRLLVLSIKPSPARVHLTSRICTVNTLLREFVKRGPKLSFVDIYHGMMQPNGAINSGLYVEDGLHMNADGYAIWRRILEPLLCPV